MNNGNSKNDEKTRLADILGVSSDAMPNQYRNDIQQIQQLIRNLEDRVSDMMIRWYELKKESEKAKAVYEQVQSISNIVDKLRTETRKLLQ